MQELIKIHLNELKKFLNNPPNWAVVLKTPTYLTGFNRHNQVHCVLGDFITRQYNLACDAYFIMNADRADFKWYQNTIDNLYGLGNIAASMFENLIQFAWLASDFDNRSLLFKNFSTIQDLESYPTNRKFFYLSKLVDVDKNILFNTKNVAETYKKKNSIFQSDSDYTNRNNYIKHWYDVDGERSIKKLSEEITLQICINKNKLNFDSVFKTYKTLCKLKHINPQECVIHSGTDDSDLQSIQFLDLKQAIASVFTGFYATNAILIQILESKQMELDNNLKLIKNYLDKE